MPQTKIQSPQRNGETAAEFLWLASVMNADEVYAITERSNSWAPTWRRLPDRRQQQVWLVDT